MSFHLYFDEANKIDQPNKAFSYYGAYGGMDTTMDQTTRTVKEICISLHTQSELHFREYNHDQYIKKYFKILNYVISQDVNVNIIIVNNENAYSIAKEMNLSMLELRKLFYIKIPERLFYGVTRHLNLPSNVEVNIRVDRSDEYSALRLYSKIKEQMNAHSVYRNKRYTIKSVRSLHSHESIPLQIIDTFMGIVVFLMEKGYTENSDASLIKSDLIYRFLLEGLNIERFQKQIKLFQWDGSDVLSELPISDYISRFIVYKSQYDTKEMTKLNSILLEYPHKPTRDYRELMGYPNTRLRMMLGYKDELEGRGRNYFLLL
ncbi:hypothetical protein D3C76_206660 [compost metagenome]